MAVGLASKILPSNIFVDSAGLDTSYGRASNKNAIEVMKNEYGIDISNHKTKDVESVNIDEYDFIVAMDQFIAEKLRKEYNINSKIIFNWDINDPYGKDYQGYKACADNINNFLNMLRKSILK